MTHGSLYSGIGGWLLAARWAGIENIFTVEIDEFCNKVLKKHFKVEQYRDIKEFSGEKYRGTIDILSTSDPCQPFSFAGKRGGTTDDRYLWPQTIRIIREIKPSYFVFENVPGFISMAFETVASDLEAEGYTVESFIIPAASVGAWHRRDRLWVIAYNEKRTWCNGKFKEEYNKTSIKDRRLCGDVSNTTKQGFQNGGGSQVGNAGKTEQESERQSGSNGGIQTFADPRLGIRKSNRGNKRMGWFSKLDKESRMEYWKAESRLGGMVDGIPDWLYEPNIPRITKGQKDRKKRLEGLGNSIVPQIAYIIFEAIKQYEINRNNT